MKIEDALRLAKFDSIADRDAFESVLQRFINEHAHLKEQVRVLRWWLKAIREVGHNDECLFCAKKDKGTVVALKAADAVKEQNK